MEPAPTATSALCRLPQHKDNRRRLDGTSYLRQSTTDRCVAFGLRRHSAGHTNAVTIIESDQQRDLPRDTVNPTTDHANWAIKNFA